jgi:hypothetical protein
MTVNQQENLENHLNWIKTHLTQIIEKDYEEFDQNQLVEEIDRELSMFNEEWGEVKNSLV